jgi:hypothetical protein
MEDGADGGEVAAPAGQGMAATAPMAGPGGRSRGMIWGDGRMGVGV